MRITTRTTAAVLVLGLGLAACSNAPDEAATDAATEAQATPAGSDAPPDDADDEGSDDEGSDDDGSTVSTSDAAFDPVSVDFDERFRDKDVEVTLDGVDVQPDGLFFRISAFNGSDRTAQLAVDPSLVYATTERGQRLAFQPPSDNPTLSFEPGETLEARLAFAARFEEVPDVAAVWFNYEDDTTPAEPQDDVTVVSATFNNLFLQQDEE